MLRDAKILHRVFVQCLHNPLGATRTKAYVLHNAAGTSKFQGHVLHENGNCAKHTAFVEKQIFWPILETG